MISASTVLKLEKDPPQSSHFGGPHHRRETTRSPSTIGKLRVCSIDLGHSFQFHPHKLSQKYILNHFFVSSKWIRMVSHNKKQTCGHSQSWCWPSETKSIRTSFQGKRSKVVHLQISKYTSITHTNHQSSISFQGAGSTHCHVPHKRTWLC